MKVPRRSLTEVQAQIFRALGHETRLKIVEILGAEGSKCVCELVERLGFDQSTVSKHLALMKSAGIVTSSKRGLRVTYTLSLRCVYTFLKCLARAEQASERELEACEAGSLCPLSGEKGCSAQQREES